MSNKRIRKAPGFSLIEVLVSLIIISIGILGVTGLLIKGLNNAKTSNLRTVASLQASSLASAMYANRQFWGRVTDGISFSSDASGTVTSTHITIPDTPSDTACASNSSVCSPADMAGNDARNWVNSVKNSLTQSATNVVCQWNKSSSGASSRSTCKITISWSEKYIASALSPASESDATAGTRSYVLHVEP